MNDFNQGLIFLPILALVIWTMIIFALIPYRRTKSVINRELKIEDFELGESESVFPYVAIVNRNFMNLLELPVLFYVACIIFYVIQEVTMIALVLSWLYVGFRVVHSLVHIISNNVRRRGNLFGVSNFILAGIWLTLILPILRIGGVVE